MGSKIADSVGKGNFKYDEFLTKATDEFNFVFVNARAVFHMLPLISASKATGLNKIPAKI